MDHPKRNDDASGGFDDLPGLPDEPAGPHTPENDPFRPPKRNCMVVCMHCSERYDSYRITWVESKGPDGRVEGFWCCPTPGCGGKGFQFDIFPVDSDWEDDEDRGISGGWFDDDGNPMPPPF